MKLQFICLILAFLPTYTAKSNKVFCLHCVDNRAYYSGDKNFPVLTPGNVLAYFKRSKLHTYLEDCQLTQFDTYTIGSYKFCDGSCLSVMVEHPENNVIGYIYACSDEYIPTDVDQMTDGDCRYDVTNGIGRSHHYKTCVCHSMYCNDPK